jgi:subtilisin family serine protease
VSWIPGSNFACPSKLDVRPGSNLNSGNGQPQDEAGHGTHVAGIAGACTNNGEGVVGVAPDATIMPVRYSDSDDIDTAMADGINFATEHGAHVINLSFGPPPGISYLPAYPATEDALQAAHDAGVVVAAASGNFSQPLCEFPSLSRHVICVSATDSGDQKAYYSDLPNNVDPNSEEPGFEPSVVAPGGQGTFCEEGIVSTYLRTLDSVCYSSGYESLDGTSMASPHVAGVAALVYDALGGQRNVANAEKVVDAIISSADDLLAPGYDPITGYGRVNALKAVRAAQG